MGRDAAASGATKASGSGPAGRSWPTTSTPSPSTPPHPLHHRLRRPRDNPQRPDDLTPARYPGQVIRRVPGAGALSSGSQPAQTELVSPLMQDRLAAGRDGSPGSHVSAVGGG